MKKKIKDVESNPMKEKKKKSKRRVILKWNELEDFSFSSIKKTNVQKLQDFPKVDHFIK